MPETFDRALVTAVRTGLAALADPAKAPEMQRYMKSDMPFRGVQKPARAELARRLFADHPLSDADTWTATVRELWHGAKYREERYVALDLTGHRGYARWQRPQLLGLYEELIVTGAWWDFVDEVANRRIGPLVRDHPGELVPEMLAWSHDPDRWKRRTSIICQLSAKGGTDTALLTHCIEANIADPDFFLRKGIGWALRQFAKTEPGWVAAFVDAHPDLSPLSRREATKHL
ncbi:DNA alkylation repair protein [Actinophytocola sp.]|uniref:DNA alkylation repair protein n=1 Tax=Actinophytocola sp. TaxID=1872138 RepID=UPI002D80EAEB|nr:DNA alkylation repair protein [Actinophytocola sp.]HET9141374.1 DNA alkylation repair protein [Actinophytocola sp.]HEU5108539.1 DNA alkylation repair protein [Micromonosporaceae bacterium]